MKAFYYKDIDAVKILASIEANGEVKIILDEEQSVLLDYIFVQMKYDSSPLNPLKVFFLLVQFFLSCINIKKTYLIAKKYQKLDDIRKVCSWKDVSVEKKMVNSSMEFDLKKLY